MADYDDEMRFVLFNNEKTNDRQPDFKGECTINGVKYRLAGWWKESKAGKRFQSGRVEPWREDFAAPPAQGEPKKFVVPMGDDEVPF